MTKRNIIEYHMKRCRQTVFMYFFRWICPAFVLLAIVLKFDIEYFISIHSCLIISVKKISRKKHRDHQSYFASFAFLAVRILPQSTQRKDTQSTQRNSYGVVI